VSHVMAIVICFLALVVGICSYRSERRAEHDRCVYECAIQRGAPMLECRPTWAACGTAREPVIATWRGER
jgi:hypothetical protein